MSLISDPAMVLMCANAFIYCFEKTQRASAVPSCLNQNKQAQKHKTNTDPLNKYISPYFKEETYKSGPFYTTFLSCVGRNHSFTYDQNTRYCDLLCSIVCKNKPISRAVMGDLSWFISALLHLQLELFCIKGLH
uniref:PPUP9740 n=1 Tax=Poeciliopsis prolifica TaxID=188132 RepID=A0A0S7ERH9_9TELE